MSIFVHMYISVGSECQVWYKRKLHLAKVKAVGSKAEVEKKEAELLEELTVPTEQCAGLKRLQESAMQKEPPHKRRRKGVCSYLLVCMHVSLKLGLKISLWSTMLQASSPCHLTSTYFFPKKKKKIIIIIIIMVDIMHHVQIS